MSRLEEFHLYDQTALETLVSAFRQAQGNQRALRELVQNAAEPHWPRALKDKLRARLKRLREMDAPEMLIENHRRQIEPRRFLLERLRQGEAIEEWELFDLALRAKKQIPAQYSFIGWIADIEGRRADPNSEMNDLYIEPFSSTNAVVREALFGSKELHIGDRATLGGERQWVHSAADLPGVRRFFEELLERPPPPREDYRRWYLPLNAHRLHGAPETQVPGDGPLAWAYANELAQAARAIRGLVTMLENAEKRRWCVQIVCE